MNFLPLLMMMNGLNGNKDKGGRQSMDVDGMIRELNQIKRFQDIGSKSEAEKMEAMLSMMGGENPEMKNMMNMVRMMSAMNKGGGNPMADMMKGFMGGPASAQSTDTPERPAPSPPPRTQETPPRSQGASTPAQGTPATEKENGGGRGAGTPLKPVAKIANKEITYMLNRYINR